MSQAQTDNWTTRKLLAWMGEAFKQKNLDSPRLLAEMLMSHVIGCDRLKLYTDPDRPASPLERQTLRDMVGRALKHEPIQYITGQAWFFGLPFKVDRRVLIPRPSTETIVEEVLQHRRATHGAAGQSGGGLLLADICTGSGCIATSLLKRLPEARGVATDISSDAIEVARENARTHGVLERLDLIEGDLLAALAKHAAAGTARAIDYLVSNPPYIPDHEWGAVEPNVKDHEPHNALRGGADGLDLVRPLIKQAPHYIRPGGLMLVEVAAAHAEEAANLARAHKHLKDTRIVRDFEGLPRVVIATKAD